MKFYIAGFMLLLLTLTVGCSDSTLTNDNTQSAIRNVKTHLLAHDRTEEQEQDRNRKPTELIAFSEIRPGMKVLDVGAGGGYMTEILSAAVGPNGSVYSQNTPFAKDFQDGNYIAPLYNRTRNNRLPNVKIKIWDMNAFPTDLHLDAAFWGTNLHDFVSADNSKVLAILDTIKHALKPGGTLVITDHVGVKGKDNAAWHRVEPGLIEMLLERAGFKNIEHSDLYRNNADPHNISVFDPQIRGTTDRYLVKAIAP